MLAEDCIEAAWWQVAWETRRASKVSCLCPQIALLDLLTSMGLRPDGIIGHSLGEVACAYADGCVSQEEAVLAAYWRGQCVKEASLPSGTMAAVGKHLSVPLLHRPLERGCFPASSKRAWVVQTLSPGPVGFLLVHLGHTGGPQFVPLSPTCEAPGLSHQSRVVRPRPCGFCGIAVKDWP